MRDDTILVAIEAALRSPDGCDCGRTLDIVSRDGAFWIECRAFAEPTRLPARVAFVLRSMTHSRSFVVDATGEAPVARETPAAATRQGTPAPATSRRVAAGA